jgi:hypothetical protein
MMRAPGQRRMATWGRRAGAAAVLALPAAAAALWAACSGSKLEEIPLPPPPPLDDQLSVTGSFCTDDPLELLFPVRILFAIDNSLSMRVTDPYVAPMLPGRVTAVRDVINAHVDEPGVEFMLMTFATSPNVLTQCDDDGDMVNDRDCFTNDRCELVGCAPTDPACNCNGVTPAIADLLSTGGTTNYVSMLARIRQKLLEDMARSETQELLRAKYVVIIVSDGLPDTDNPDQNAVPCLTAPYSCAIYDAVDDILDLRNLYELGDLRVHTVYLSGNTPDYATVQPAQLLAEMADVGEGTYRDFGNGETINFLSIDFTAIRRRFALKSIIATNRNVRSLESRLAVDSDGDGLHDDLEVLFGTDPVLADTDGDGFDDQLEYTLRFSGPDATDPADGQCFAGVDDFDSDGDGMLDCAERFLGTSPVLIDSDADGMLDSLEITNGTDPAIDDAFDDIDFDGSTNMDEVRVHLNPTEDDVQLVSDLAYRYYVSETGIVASRTCYDFRVDNVRLLTTAAPPGGEDGWNDVYVWLDMAPFDNYSDYGTYRVGCVRARFLDYEGLLDPAQAVMNLDETDFKRPVGDACIDDSECPMGHTCNLASGSCIGPTVFDPAVDCKEP